MYMAARTSLILGAFIVGGAFFHQATLPAQERNPSVSSSGAEAYAAECASCHGTTMTGGFGPALVGAEFKAKWAAASPAALRDYIVATMPPVNPGGLSDAVYSALTDHILASNDLPVLDKEGNSNAQSTDRLTAENETILTGLLASGEHQDEIYREEMRRRAALLDRMSPVTDAMLREPPDGDWLSWRRTYDAHGYTPLASVNRKNVGRLRVAWAMTLPAGTNQITPLVHDGVMFVNSDGVVQAIDAATGDLLWKYTRRADEGLRIGAPVSQARGLAIHESTLFVPTIDNHMIALDARRGTVLWDREIQESDNILRLLGAPLVVKNMVLQGVAGCAGAYYPGGCFIVALDVRTGEELWRFQTLTRPGSPDDRWNGAPLEKRFGGSVWVGGSYDPALDLVYFGIGQTYRISPLLLPEPSDPTMADALYTDSTVALDTDTGRLVWHYQHMQRDVWDFDWAFERMLIDVPSAKGHVRAVATIGKLGILDVLDAKTGSYLFSHDLGLQNLITAIDPRTGRKQVDPAKQPQPDEVIDICPFAGGARNWPATAYDPAKKLLFVPLTENCMDYVWKPGEEWEMRYGIKPRPDSDGNFGRVTAVDLGERTEAWRERRRAPEASAILATAGGLIFEGGRDRWFRASDSATGEILWQTRLDDVPNAAPISFASGDEQYVSVTTGGGGAFEASTRKLTPEIQNPGGATTLWVFALDRNQRSQSASTN